jgi:hypothetical protein
MSTEQQSVRDQIAIQLDAIPDGALEDPGEILVEWPIAIASREEDDDEVSDVRTTIFNMLTGRRCRDSGVLDVSGGAVTNASGVATIRIGDFVCLSDLDILSLPVNLVATPRARTPTYLTVRTLLANHGVDENLSFEVYAWNAQAQPAGGAPFYWRCTIGFRRNVA